MTLPSRRRAESSAPSRASTLTGVALVLLLMMLGLMLRLPGLERGATSDELANIMQGTAAQIFADPEAGVNPPLLRMLFNPVLGDHETLRAGRWFSLVWSTAAVGLAGWVGFLAAGRRWGGAVLAAAMLAFHPIAVKYGTIYRVYGWWSGVMLLHVGSLSSAMEAKGKDKYAWGAFALLSACLLPWIHYFTVPIFLGFGVLLLLQKRSRWLWVYGASALSISPMIPFVLHSPERRVSAGDTLWSSLQKITALDLVPPSPLANPAVGLYRALGGESFRWPVWMSLGTVLLLVVGLLCIRKLPQAAKMSLAGALSVLGGAVVLAQVQYVRDPTVVMLAVFVAPFLGGLAGLIDNLWLRILSLLSFAAWFGWSMPDRLAYYDLRRAEFDARPLVMERLPSFNGVRGGRPVFIYPDYEVGTAYFYGMGEHFGQARWNKQCPSGVPCFVMEGTRVQGIRQVGDGAQVDGLLISFSDHHPEGFAASCDKLDGGVGYGIWNCSLKDVPKD